LTSATIRFHTGGDDKDHDTHVRVDLCTPNDEIAAYIDSNLGYIPDGTDSTYLLQINEPWFTQDRVQKGYVHIRIDTRGDERWVFSYTLRLTYSNGDTTTVDAPTWETGSVYKYTLTDEDRTAYFRTSDGQHIEHDYASPHAEFPYDSGV
jgi:hypothetical protein